MSIFGSAAPAPAVPPTPVAPPPPPAFGMIQGSKPTKKSGMTTYLGGDTSTAARATGAGQAPVNQGKTLLGT